MVILPANLLDFRLPTDPGPAPQSQLVVPLTRNHIEAGVRTQVTTEVLVPMRTSLTNSGWLDAPRSADEILPNLAVIPTHYDRLVQSIGTSGTELRQLRSEVEPLRTASRDVLTLRSKATELCRRRTAFETRATEAKRRLTSFDRPRNVPRQCSAVGATS